MVKLRRLALSRFKNLHDFEIIFGEQPFTTVILGQNGTGKSNLLEALIIIFRNLDLGEPPEFAYQLAYECRGVELHIDADPARQRREQVKITAIKQDARGRQETAISYHQFYTDSERRYLPSYIFGYYSGPSNRMARYFDKHQERFYRDLLKGVEQPLRPLLYARPEHSQFALLSFFTEAEQSLNAGETNILDFLREHLGIESLDSVLFILRQPPWLSREGDKRFWNARGVVRDLLARIYELALAPLRLKVRFKPEFANTTSLEHLYLYLRSVKELKALAAQYASQQEFFKALESTYISKILSEVRIRVQVRKADGSLTFRDMSEGEQQLLMVLGLLRFTKEEEALFLLDEPDTHLNPAWGIQYLNFMHKVVGDLPTSHVIMSTHNPLVISSLKREDVRIMQREEGTGRVEAIMPRENPLGMGVANILTSEFFGLRFALDLPTQELLDQRRELALKEELSPDERHRLGELTGYLESLGYTLTEDEPLYAAFLKKFQEREDAQIQQKIALTPQEYRERIDVIDEIIDELIMEGRWL